MPKMRKKKIIYSAPFKNDKSVYRFMEFGKEIASFEANTTESGLRSRGTFEFSQGHKSNPPLI